MGMKQKIKELEDSLKLRDLETDALKNELRLSNAIIKATKTLYDAHLNNCKD